MSSNKDRIKYLLYNLHKNSLTCLKVPAEKLIISKDPKIALEYRKKGNNYFLSKQPGHLDQAFEEYTKSLAYSPPGSQESSLAYANRSAVLFEVGFISGCLKDIARAFDSGYPDNLKAQLFLRKAMCHRAQCSNVKHKNIDFDESLVQVYKWLEKMEDDKKQTIKKKLEELCSVQKIIDKSLFFDDKSFILPKLKAENSSIPGLSDAVELKWSAKFGRHFVAARDIKPGETLVVRKPYAKIISDNVRYKFCWHCGRQAWSSIACNNCVYVVYCSEACRDFGWQEHHEIECPIVGAMKSIFGMPDVLFMGLRLTVRALEEAGRSLEFLRGHLEQIDAEGDKEKRGFTNGTLDEKKFASVYGLEYNPGSRSNKITFINPIFTAYLLATKTKIFSEQVIHDLSDFKDDEKFIFLVELIERNTQLASNNSLKIMIPDAKCEKSVEVFHITEPVLCLFNHSCNPSLTRSLYGEFIVNTSINSIRRGEQIFDNYGISFIKLSKAERQSILLSKFNFICSCEACTNNWPMKILKTVEKKNSQCSKIVQDISRFSKKIENIRHFVDCLKEKKKLLNELKNDISKIIQAIEVFSLSYDKNSVETIGSVLLLREYLRFTENHYLSLD